ncbi:MAG: transcription elongation factor GreA [Patescibacteria group bacterium]
MTEVQYVSEEGLKALQDELDYRKNTSRMEIAEKISVAKEQGDLSENFEYQDAKDQQAENETRIGELEGMLARAVVVEKKEGGTSISIGTTFEVETLQGDKKTFEIVGPTETDPIAGKISNESPLGKAFLGKTAGDSAEIETPSGMMQYKILSIK